MFKLCGQCRYNKPRNTAVASILRRGSGVAKLQISVAPKELISLNELAWEKKK